ncbi:MAG TPA: hypothetical protein PKE39_01330 [Ignavibacteria bacterium]|nr:hypothetical protein [Ignavibacteria bacterium]HMQ97639.1 hypothetical protein [Ignavibacteria bacterium]
MKNRNNIRFSPIVSRETFSSILGFLAIALFSTIFSGCGEDTISEDISVFNKVLSTRYDIKAPEDLAKFYHDYLYDNPEAKLTYEMSPQTHNRVKIVMINQNPVDPNLHAEKIEMVAKYDETMWKIVVINRNWKCRSKGEPSEWGIEPCN